MDVLNLRGVLTLDKTQYDSGLDTAEKSAHSFGGRFSKVMKVGAAAAVALGAATAVMGKKIVDGAKDVAEYGDKVDKMSQKIGISSDAYQKWDYVMQRAGGNVDQLKMGMKTLSQQAEKNSDAFQKLGISQEEVKNLNQEQLFERTIKGLSDMEAGTERTALASQLLGRAGADMGPLLNQGSEAIEEQMEIAEKYGMVMPEEAVKASAAFEDSMTTLQMTAQGLKNRLLGEFLPAMTQVTDGLALMFTGDMSGLDDVIGGVKDFIGKISEMVPTLLEVGGKLLVSLVEGLVQKVPDLISAAGNMIVKLAEGLANGAGNLKTAATQIITSIATFLADNTPILIQAALTIIIAIAQGLIEAIPKLAEAIPKVIDGIVMAFINYDWSGLGASILAMMASGMGKSSGNIPQAINKAITNAKNIISNGFSTAKDKALGYMDGLKDGAKRKIDSAKESIKKAVDKIKGFFPLKVGKIFSNIKIPHINVSGGKAPFGIGGLGTKPKISVSWNKKAEDVPYLFTNATLFGAGEGTQDEILYGRKSLLNDIEEVTSKQSPPQITQNVYVSGAEDPRKWANIFAQEYKMALRSA